MAARGVGSHGGFGKRECGTELAWGKSSPEQGERDGVAGLLGEVTAVKNLAVSFSAAGGDLMKRASSTEAPGSIPSAER